MAKVTITVEANGSTSTFEERTGLVVGPGEDVGVLIARATQRVLQAYEPEIRTEWSRAAAIVKQVAEFVTRPAA